VEAAAAARRAAPTVLAVTVLTSLGEKALAEIGYSGTAETTVERLAGLAATAGAGGLVCSAHELAAARRLLPGGLLVVPGIRPSGARVREDDQARVTTPSRAVQLGADLLVIGRPITQAPDPAAAATAIARELEDAATRGGPE
jgi:orotidine-5'-phosphate decarboxylase